MGIKMSNSMQMPIPPSVAKNPLTKLFRQPAIYFMPPSQGRWWPMGAMNVPETGEFAVFPMTSKDEVTLRTPDALLNGQGMVEVIQSCVPDIKDAWKMPATDVDATLIAIRIASYGHKMDFESKCPLCEETHTYALDLRGMLDSIKLPDFEQTFNVNGLTLKFRPQAYYGMNKVSKINFEVHKLGQALDALEDGDERVRESMVQMNRLVDLNLEVLTECTDHIIMDENPEEKIKNKEYILEFYKNIPSALSQQIQKAYTDIAKKGAVPPVKTNCAGCNEEIDMSIEFDYTNFFVAGS
jgi:hypothetical protein